MCNDTIFYLSEQESYLVDFSIHGSCRIKIQRLVMTPRREPDTAVEVPAWNWKYGPGRKSRSWRQLPRAEAKVEIVSEQNIGRRDHSERSSGAPGLQHRNTHIYALTSQRHPEKLPEVTGTKCRPNRVCASEDYPSA